MGAGWCGRRSTGEGGGSWVVVRREILCGFENSWARFLVGQVALLGGSEELEGFVKRQWLAILGWTGENWSMILVRIQRSLEPFQLRVFSSGGGPCSCLEQPAVLRLNGQNDISQPEGNSRPQQAHIQGQLEFKCLWELQNLKTC